MLCKKKILQFIAKDWRLIEGENNVLAQIAFLEKDIVTPYMGIAILVCLCINMLN